MLFKSFKYILCFLLIKFFIFNLSIVYLSIIINNKNNISNYLCNALNHSKNQFRVTLDGITYPNIVPLYHNNSINFKCLNSSTSTKIILMWNKFNGLPFIKYGFGIRQPFFKMNCPVTNCELTNNRSKFKDSDLVLFHLRNKIDYFPSI